MRGLTLAFAGLALLALLGGCAGLGGSPIDRAALAQNATYDCDAPANATVTVTSDEYEAVIQIENRSSVALASHGGFGGRRPLQIRAIQFRYPNGTVVGAEAFSVRTSNSRTVVELPADEGQFAYTASSGPRSLQVPVVVDGSHVVVLPPGMRVAFPVFGSVQPGGYEKTLRDDRVRLAWESVSAETIDVQYYLQRDLYIFGGLVALLALLALGGVVYFRIQIRRLERNREEAGFDAGRE